MTSCGKGRLGKLGHRSKAFLLARAGDPGNNLLPRIGLREVGEGPGRWLTLQRPGRWMQHRLGDLTTIFVEPGTNRVTATSGPLVATTRHCTRIRSRRLRQSLTRRVVSLLLPAGHDRRYDVRAEGSGAWKPRYYNRESDKAALLEASVRSDGHRETQGRWSSPTRSRDLAPAAPGNRSSQASITADEVPRLLGMAGPEGLCLRRRNGAGLRRGGG